MKRFYNKAIFALRPNAQFVQRGSTYSGLEWLDTTSKKPTENEIEEKIAEFLLSEPLRLLRIQRDQLLSQTDYITLRAYSQGQEVPQEWADYMQALRDLPSTASPQLDDNGQLTNVTWPTKPE